jgi:hypothetical protein
VGEFLRLIALIFLNNDYIYYPESEWVDFTRSHSGGNNGQREIIKRKNYYYRRIINGFLRKKPTNYLA